MTTTTQYVYKTMSSPVGTLRLIASDKGLAGVWFERSRPERVKTRTSVESRRHPVLVEAERQLREYFAGRRRGFDLKLDFVGTPFQRTVWQALLTIPFGQTRSYGEIAKQVGRPSACRAVGAANGQNPIAVVVPCHRVIAAGGRLGGYGGSEFLKRSLLAAEGVIVAGGRVRELDRVRWKAERKRRAG